MLETSVFVLDNIDVGNRAFNIFMMLVIGHRRRKKINNRKPSLSQIPRDQIWTITEGKSKAEVKPVFRTDPEFWQKLCRFWAQMLTYIIQNWECSFSPHILGSLCVCVFFSVLWCFDMIKQKLTLHAEQRLSLLARQFLDIAKDPVGNIPLICKLTRLAPYLLSLACAP